MVRPREFHIGGGWGRDGDSRGCTCSDDVLYGKGLLRVGTFR